MKLVQVVSNMFFADGGVETQQSVISVSKPTSDVEAK